MHSVEEWLAGVTCHFLALYVTNNSFQSYINHFDPNNPIWGVKNSPKFEKKIL